MRYPYERFLWFLVSRKLDVNQQLEKYGLPPVGPLWVSRCRRDIRGSAPPAVVQYLDDENDTAPVLFKDGFLAWADDQKIGQLWRVQPEFGNKPISDELDVAFRIFMNPYARTLLGLLLLSRVADEDRIQIVQERLDLGVDKPTLNLYRDIFWDVTLMPRTAWPDFVEQLDEDQRNFLVIGYRDELATDDVRAVLDLGRDYKSTGYEDTLHLIIRTAENEFRNLMTDRGKALPAADRIAYMAKLSSIINENIRTAKGMTGKAVPGAPGDGVTAPEFRNMFSVKVSKSRHVTLAELQGHFSAASDSSKPRGNG